MDDDASHRRSPAFVLARSTILEAVEVFIHLVEAGMRTILFGKVRIITEVVTAQVHQYYAAKGVRPESVVRAYRAGYTPEIRREIEAELFSGALRGVIATNALELGVDIGSLDAVVHLGFPGSVSSLFQQAGRAGRRGQESVSILVAHADPLDQHYMKNPDALFRNAAEDVVVDPDNRVLLEQHLRCAAYELVVQPAADVSYFGSDLEDAAAVSKVLVRRPGPAAPDGTTAAQLVYPYDQPPHSIVSIRTIEEDRFVVADYSIAPRGRGPRADAPHALLTVPV